MHRPSRDGETERKQNRDILMGEKLFEGRGRKECRDEDTRNSPASPPTIPAAAPLPSLAGWGRGPGSGVPAGPSRAGRSLGKARRPYSDLRGCPPQLYNLLPQPGGRGRWTDRRMDWTDRRGPGRAGRAGEAPAAMVSPRHGPTDTSLCAAKAPQGRFYGWVPGPRNAGPRPPPPQGTQESAPRPLPHQGPKNSGPRPLPPHRSPQSRPPSLLSSPRFRSPSPQPPSPLGTQEARPPSPLPQTWESGQACLLGEDTAWLPGSRVRGNLTCCGVWSLGQDSSLPTCQIQKSRTGVETAHGIQNRHAFLGIFSPLSSLPLASHHAQH